MNIVKKDNCKKCFLCVEYCPVTTWRRVNDDVEPSHPELCIGCGHCVSVCPVNAIDHSLIDMTKVRKVNKNLIKSDSFEEIMLSRRSIRHYKDKDVPEDVIESILDIARFTPTATNSQTITYTVITDKSLIKKLSDENMKSAKKMVSFFNSFLGQAIIKLTRADDSYLQIFNYIMDNGDPERDYVLYNAPVLIIIHGSKKDKFSYANCNMAAANIMNHAHSLGLGTCFIGFLVLLLKKKKKLRKLIGISKSHEIHTCLVMGYPKGNHKLTVTRKRARVNRIQ